MDANAERITLDTNGADASVRDAVTSEVFHPASAVKPTSGGSSESVSVSLALPQLLRKDGTFEPALSLDDKTQKVP